MAKALIYGESSWLRCAPCTMTLKEITAIGTLLDFTFAIKVVPTHTGAAEAAESKAAWHTTEIANGNKCSVPDNSNNTNILTDETISEDGASAVYGKFDASVLASPAQRLTLIDMFDNGTPGFWFRETGKDAGNSGAIAGYEVIFGVISDLKENQAKGPSSFDIAISGKTIGETANYQLGTDVDMADVNTAATGATHTITPHNDGSARTIPALQTTQWDKLIAGKVAQLAAA